MSNINKFRKDLREHMIDNEEEIRSTGYGVERLYNESFWNEIKIGYTWKMKTIWNNKSCLTKSISLTIEVSKLLSYTTDQHCSITVNVFRLRQLQNICY